MDKNPFKKTLMNSRRREWVRRRIEQYVIRRIENVIVHPVEYDFYGEKQAVQIIQRYGSISMDGKPNERLWEEPPEYPELESESCSFILEEMESDYKRNFTFED
jgi:hypothetical protein